MIYLPNIIDDDLKFDIYTESLTFLSTDLYLDANIVCSQSNSIQKILYDKLVALNQHLQVTYKPYLQYKALNKKNLNLI